MRRLRPTWPSRTVVPLALLASLAVLANAVGHPLAADDPPGQPAPDPKPAPAPAPPPGIDPDAAPSGPIPNPPAAPLVNGKKRRVHIIEDRYHEWSGTVEAEDSDYIVIDSKGRLKGFYKSRIQSLIPLVDPEPNQPGVVTMRDGRTYQGIILDDAFDYVEISIEGIKQRLPREAVFRTTLTLTPRQAYEQAKRIIKPDQYSDRLRLAQFLYDNKMYPEARDELRSLLELVDLHEAKELLRVVEAQLALGQPVESPGVHEDDEGPVGESGPVDLKDTLPSKLLTPEDINTIRVYEIDFNRPPRVTITPDTIREMIERYASSDLIPASSEGRTALFREDPLKLVRLLFDLKARDLYPKIKVETEPYSLNLFRQRVHNAWLINNCATSNCHGGVDAGRFFLHNRNAKSAAVRYTNLLILERTKLEGRPPLIDWDEPLESLIVQYAKPRTEARHPHPDVKGWKPVFNNTNQRLLEDYARWVKAMYRPRPDYPVNYEPPKLDAPDSAPSSTKSGKSRPTEPGPVPGNEPPVPR